jgi:hypothetical protein
MGASVTPAAPPPQGIPLLGYARGPEPRASDCGDLSALARDEKSAARDRASSMMAQALLRVPPELIKFSCHEGEAGRARPWDDEKLR